MDDHFQPTGGHGRHQIQQLIAVQIVGRRDALGPKLAGKLHFAVGELDTYYLERAVHLTQQFLDSTREPGKGPYADATFDFGPGRPHGYTGDIFLPAPVAGGTLTQRMMPVMMEHMLKTAPAGADTKSWRY